MTRSEQVRRMLMAHWVPEGYASPHALVYPWQWLWDSCFHSLVWEHLGDRHRALTELDAVLSTQGVDGFVPHMNYVRDPEFHAAFWGRSGASNITQPPMFGHAVAELRRRGVPVPVTTVERAGRGLEFLLTRRRRHDGLVLLAHPWETGCDDSPRWDDLCPGDAFDLARWKARKGDLVASVAVDESGAAVGNDAFTVASAGFNALVAFNAAELGLAVDDLQDALDARWDAGRTTWSDAGDTETGSGRARTLDGLLPVLVERRPARIGLVFEQVLDDGGYGGPFGPAGVHRDEASFAPSTYWRGPAWPQLSYLLWIAARRHHRDAVAGELARRTVAGAFTSGLAEYWNPDTAQGLGAIPQSWTGLALVMAEREGLGEAFSDG